MKLGEGGLLVHVEEDGPGKVATVHTAHVKLLLTLVPLLLRPEEEGL